ncbi:MAG TPA: 4Fe-4S dicluster domain-containing protein [Anaerolineae bacterium]|nr:4Fe-4S dicluster domain-containing protein [Anaerolineae bacterium]
MAKPMRALKVENLDILIEAVSHTYRTYGPVAKDGEHAWELVDPDSAVYLGCAVTMLPAKHILQPVRLDLYTFTLGDGFQIEEPSFDERIALFGVSPCDVNAILALDRVFRGKFIDPYYWKRRDSALIVAANCTEVAEESFCTSWDTGPELHSDYDLLITELADSYLLEVGSQRGNDIANGLNLPKATQEDLEEKAARLDAARAATKKKLPVAPDDLHQLFKDRYDHPIWVSNADVCFSCGNCTFSCPTCFCFDIRDEIKPSRREGVRNLEWDSCQLLEFAEVAHHANFRRLRIDRFKHRTIHKLSWMKQQYGLTGCVGCGRCVRWCPSWPVRRGRITSLADPVEIIADMLEPPEKIEGVERPGGVIV